VTATERLQARFEAALMGNYGTPPVALARGEGCRVWDVDGREYLDLYAGIAVSSLGHAHPAIAAAVSRQVAAIAHTSNLFLHEGEVALAERLLALLDAPGRVFFCNSGTEANEAAIKLARRARPQGKIVVLQEAFHGRTYGALSGTPQEAKQAPFAPLVPGFEVVAKSPDAVVRAVDENTAAVLLEPIQGETGIHVLDQGVLRAARAACDEVGAALIFDEIQTGMGRTGTLWAYEQTGVVPDAMTSAKALGGGLPAGALVTGPGLADVFETGDHGSTFAGGPVVARSALVALEICSDPALLASVRTLGERLRAGLAELAGVADVRGRGLMVGVDFAEGVSAVEIARRALLEQRLVINATGPSTVRLEPPLVVSEAEIDEALSRLGAILG
jgi:acetylornithine/N-succinyldiaminopimelate aminotransferase